MLKSNFGHIKLDLLGDALVLLRCSDMYAKAAKTMAFNAKRWLNLLDVFMTNYTSIYYEKANSCCFYVVNSKKTLVLCVK